MGGLRMIARLDSRIGHWLLLTTLWAATCLSNLGATSLWDIDEGNNSVAGWEMLDSGNWIVPMFNAHVRYDKPVLLYWLQAGAYSLCGVNEFAARLPSAIAALLALLVTYEIGRALFGKMTGFSAGMVLGSSVAFCASARFANPDALLDLCTALALFSFWKDISGGGLRWSLVTGAAAGLGVLAKGPVGLVLPTTVAVLFLLWRREWRQLFHRRGAVIALAVLAVAAPWYIWVAAETKGQWLYEFWMQHNFRRMTTPLENHHGPVFYYLLVLVAGLAPWSVFLGPTAWLAWRSARRDGDAARRPAVQFLLCWVAVYFVFFSMASTKLPNYILPLYPAAAVLLGQFLDMWRRGEIRLPVWVERTSLVCLGVLGIGVAVGMLVASGVLPVGIPPHRWVPGLQTCAVLGLLWVAAAGVAAWRLALGCRGQVIAVVAVVAVVVVVGGAGWGAAIVDRCKAPRPLAAALPADQLRRDVRIGTLDYFQPSLVFYCGREVRQLRTEWELAALMGGPLPAFAFLPERQWEELRGRLPKNCHPVAHHHDLYDGCDVVLVTNE
jgi:4-amino-4-deoxy-L-arabinose transferase-like glycosyltransferase